MKISKSLASGFCRTLKAWRGILIIWAGSLLTALFLAAPLRRFFKSGFGDSMITDRLQDGIDVEVFGDLGNALGAMMSSFTAGIFVLMIISLLLKVFLTGGIFDVIRRSSGRFSGRNFFKACSANFWPFLVITILVNTMLLLLFLVLFIVPVSLASQSASGSETLLFKTLIIAGVLYFLVSLVFVTAADYARSWQAANEKPDCFGAIGFGFSTSFRTFFSSYPVVLFIAIIQFLLTWFSVSFIGKWTPDTGAAVFLLFIISQILILTRISVKVIRYGSITFLKEVNEGKAKKVVNTTALTENQNLQL